MTGPDFKRSEFVSCAAAGRGNSRSYAIENGEVVYVDTEISIGFANGENGVASYATDIEISEVVSSNTKYLAGPYKTYHDFVELHNRTDAEIDLTGYYLSDDPEQVRKGSLDGVKVPANGYICIILSSDGINTPKGYHVVNFGINASGETLVLAKGDTVTDVAVIPSLGQNTAFGRATGDDAFSVLAPTAQPKRRRRPRHRFRKAFIPTALPLSSKATARYITRSTAPSRPPILPDTAVR